MDSEKFVGMDVHQASISVSVMNEARLFRPKRYGHWVVWGVRTLENLLRMRLLRLAGKGLTHRSLSINSGFGEFLQQTTELALEDLGMEWSRAFLLIFDTLINDQPNQLGDAMCNGPSGAFALDTRL